MKRDGKLREKRAVLGTRHRRGREDRKEDWGQMGWPFHAFMPLSFMWWELQRVTGCSIESEGQGRAGW